MSNDRMPTIDDTFREVLFHLIKHECLSGHCPHCVANILTQMTVECLSIHMKQLDLDAGRPRMEIEKYHEKVVHYMIESLTESLSEPPEPNRARELMEQIMGEINGKRKH